MPWIYGRTFRILSDSFGCQELTNDNEVDFVYEADQSATVFNLYRALSSEICGRRDFSALRLFVPDAVQRF